jgi:uncharacterized SAM-binding protein YcdF (DUF218 family)
MMWVLHRRPSRRRFGALCVSTAAIIIAAFLVLTAVLFVWPSTNTPRRSDAIVVLGGSGLRVQKGVALARAGYAPYLAISITPNAPCPPPPTGVKVVCFTPNPLTTQGEARAVAKLAREHHWRQIIVVSNVPQTTRARIRLDRCYDGTLLFDPVSPGGFSAWIYGIVYEWGSLIKALTLQRGC